VAALVDDGQKLEHHAVASDVKDQVHAPHVVDALGFDLRLWASRTARTPGGAEHSQALAPTHSLHRAPGAAVAAAKHHRVHPAVTVTRILYGQLHDHSLRLHAPLPRRLAPIGETRTRQPEVPTRLP